MFRFAFHLIECRLIGELNNDSIQTEESSGKLPNILTSIQSPKGRLLLVVDLSARMRRIINQFNGAQGWAGAALNSP